MSEASPGARRASREDPLVASIDETVSHATLVAEVTALTNQEEPVPPPPPPSRRRHGGHKAGWVGRLIEVVLAIALTAGGCGVAVWLLPVAPPQPASKQAVRQVGLYCPGAADYEGSVSGTGTDAVLQPSSGPPSMFSAPFFQQSITGPSALTGTGAVAATAQFTRAGQSATAACAPPMSSGYLLVGAPNATLVLTNVDDDDAVLNITLISRDKQIVSDELVDFKVPGNTTVEVPLDKYAAGIAPLAIGWQDTIGRIVAWVRIDTTDGFDIVSPTKTATQIVVPGIPADAKVTLLLANPTARQVVAQVDALTAAGRVTVAGGEQVMIETGSVTGVDLSAVQGQAVSLVVTAEQPIAAAAWLTIGADFATAIGVVAQDAVNQDRLGVAADPGQLMLSNLGESSADVTVTDTLAAGASFTQTLTLNAGETALVALASAGVVRVQAPPGVTAALIAQPGGIPDNGTSIVPLSIDPAWAGVMPVWVEGQPS